MPHARLGLALLLLAALAVAGCASDQPGWTYAPPPSMTPIASVEASAEASAAPSAPASPAASVDASPAASEPAGSPAASDGAGGTVVQVSAANILFEQATLEVPAETPFTIEFANNDNAVPHDVDIRDSAGTSLFKTDTFPGVETRTFDAPALPAGAYQFVCSVHPTTMIIDVTAQ